MIKKESIKERKAEAKRISEMIREKEAELKKDYFYK